jgi:PAS domain S-box-containing protein
VIAKKRYSVTTNWFLLFLGGATLMAVAEGFQRLSINPVAALFWQNAGYIGFALLPMAFYLFIVSFTGQYKRQYIFLSSVLMLAWGTITFFAGSGLFYVHSLSLIQHAPWGYYSNPTIAEKISVAWFIVFYIIGTILLLIARKTNQNKLIRKQIITFLLAFLVPFIAAIITVVIIPIYNPNVFPPIATLVGAFSGILIYYGIFRYRLFEIDPQVLAQNILDTMNEAVIIAQPDMSIESINYQAERLLGISGEAIHGHKLQSFFSDNSWKFILEQIVSKSVYGNNPATHKDYVRSTDGKITPVRISLSSLKIDGEKIANIIVLSDITEITKSFDILQDSASRIYKQNEELIKLELQLREQKANVEKIVEIRTKALVDAQNKLKAEDQLKTEFIMLTSHNLRTPLAIARGYAEIIQTKFPVSEVEKPLITGLNNGLDQLGKIVEDLLTISSIESGYQLTLKDTLFSTIIDPLIKEAKELALTRNDKLIVNFHAGDVRLKADFERLQGALRNVLNNACKFTENGIVEVNTNRLEDHLIISVSDTGIGIEPTELPKIFGKFHRAANALDGDYAGRGIGLYLTKLIVEEHGGKISVVSQPKQGSAFTIELPCY